MGCNGRRPDGGALEEEPKQIMRYLCSRLFLGLVLLVFTINSFGHGDGRRKSNSRVFHPPPVTTQSGLHEVTLFSRIGRKDQDYGRSAYNFYAFARSDKWPKITRNRAHLLYGSISINGDTDWFAVSMGGEDPSRIKDLGQMQWSEVVATPFLATLPHSTTGVRTPRRGESYEESSEGRVTKVVAEHMYVIHIKNDEEDFYVMLRVDALEPSDNCTISWKVVPSPEN